MSRQYTINMYIQYIVHTIHIYIIIIMCMWSPVCTVSMITRKAVYNLNLVLGILQEVTTLSISKN